MGLDVYLYTKAQQLQNEAHNKEETDFYGAEWELYDSKTEAEKEHFRNNRQFHYVHQTDVPARAYPGKSTLNNRRYLRSSYNGGGFNSAVPRLLGRPCSYEWIFEKAIAVDSGEYDKWWTEEDIPGLSEAAQRAAQVAVDLLNLETPLSVLTVSGNMFSAPPTVTETEALDWAKLEVEKAKGQSDDAFFGSGGWQNGFGHFYGLGDALLEVVAAVPGQDYFGTPAVHLVYKAGDALDSYIESVTIVGEFAEEAIELIREDGSCYVSWSG
jgi:hypothetical protein